MKKTGKILIGVLSVGALVGTGYAAWHINNGFVSTSTGNVNVSVNDMIINSFAKVVVEDTDTKAGLSFDGGQNEDLHLSYNVKAVKNSETETKNPYDLTLYENVAKEYIPDLKVTVKAYKTADSSTLTSEELAKVTKFITLPEVQTYSYTEWLSKEAETKGHAINLDFSWSKATFNGQNPEVYFKENPSETAEATIKEMIETLIPITFKVHFDVGQYTYTEPDKSGTITIPEIANSTLTIAGMEDGKITAGEHLVSITLDEGKQIKDNKLIVVENGKDQEVTLSETRIRAAGKTYTCTYNFLKDATYSFKYVVENIPPKQITITEGTHENVTFTTAEGKAIDFTAKHDIGSTFTFKASAVEGYELKEVKHNNEVLVAKEGKYEFVVVDGNNTISATATKILPKKVSVTEGTHTNVEFLTTTGEAINFENTYEVGSTFSFKAEAKKGFKLEEVKHNETTLTEKDGVYSFKIVDGTNEISARASEIPVVVEKFKVTLDSTSTEGATLTTDKGVDLDLNTEYEKGTSLKFKVKYDEATYTLKEVTYNGTKLTDETGVYTITIGETNTIKVTLEKIETPVETPLDRLIPITVDELSKKAEPDSMNLYSVTGIVTEALDSDKFGNIVLTDKITGESIKAYGTAKDETCWTFSDTTPITFTNPRDFNTECLGKLFNVNDEVKFNVYTYLYNGKVNYNFQFVEKVTDSKNLTYKVSFESEAANYFEPLNKEGFTLGEEVLLKPISSKIPEGKKLEVLHNGSQISANEQGCFAINVGVINKISANLLDANAVADLVLSLENIKGLGASYNGSEKDITITGTDIKIHVNKVLNSQSSIQFNDNTPNGSILYNITALDKEIDKIVLNEAIKGKTNSKGSYLYASFATDASSLDTTINTKKEQENSTNPNLVSTDRKIIDDQGSYELKNNVSGATYFCISHASDGQNIFLESIEIYFK